jgi:opacity protein-like surface antigen
MFRFVRLGILSLAAMLCLGSASAQAQTTPVAADTPWYGEVNVGATFGHKSDSSVGGEAGYRLGETYDVFLELGHIGNAATSDFEGRGQKIAAALDATVASASEAVTYFDVGARYRFLRGMRAQPYASLGIGFAAVKTRTDFAVGGTVVDPETLGVQKGSDLEGSFTRPFIMIGVGATADFAGRYFADVSYRYGRVGSDSSDGITALEAVSTQRFQVGVGLRF